MSKAYIVKCEVRSDVGNSHTLHMAARNLPDYVSPLLMRIAAAAQLYVLNQKKENVNILGLIETLTHDKNCIALDEETYHIDSVYEVSQVEAIKVICIQKIPGFHIQELYLHYISILSGMVKEPNFLTHYDWNDALIQNNNPRMKMLLDEFKLCLTEGSKFNLVKFGEKCA